MRFLNSWRTSNGLLMRAAACAAIASLSVNVRPQQNQVPVSPKQTNAPNSQPRTIDDLIVSIRSHLGDDFLCWEADRIERYWGIPIFPRAAVTAKSDKEMELPMSPGERARPLERYMVYSRTFQRNGESYKGVHVFFNAIRKPSEKPEVSYRRLFELFGNPTSLIRIQSEIAPPPPGERPAEIKREGDFQERHLEWEEIAPDVLVMADTGFRSEVDSVMAVKKVKRGCE